MISYLHIWLTFFLRWERGGTCGQKLLPSFPSPGFILAMQITNNASGIAISRPRLISPLPCGYVCRPPPCHNQGLLGRGPGWELTPPLHSSLHPASTADSPEPQDFALDCKPAADHIRHWCASRRSPRMEPLGLTAGAQLSPPGPGVQTVFHVQPQRLVSSSQSLHFPSVRRRVPSACVARQGDHPEGRAGWSWADSDAHPQHRTPTPSLCFSVSPGADSSGDESTSASGP